jgi:hypothetical protein
MTPRTVVVPGAGGNSLSFAIPPGVEFDVESVLAAVDTAAAGATFGELSISDQSGVVIATKRQGLPIPGGSSGTETWALGLNDEDAGAAAGFPNLPYAVASTNTVSIPIGVVGTFIFPDLINFDTNEPTVYTHDSTGGGGHSGGIFIQAAGRYLAFAKATFEDPAGAPVEPAASQMYCVWDSYNYNGSESDFFINHTIATGYPGFPFAPWGTALTWEPWSIDQQDIGAAFVGPPFSEYHAALWNGSTTQAMNARAAVMVLRIGDSDGL